MPRDFVINGETLVKVKFGAHVSGTSIGGFPTSGVYTNYSELGLATDQIRVSPTWRHQDVHTDDFGPDVPAEVLFMLGWINVRMNLIHWDRNVLAVALREATGQTPGGLPQDATLPMSVPGAGTPLGNGIARTLSGCHYIGVNLVSPQLGLPMNFLDCYLAEQPVVLPLGTEKSVVQLNWRCIPYTIFSNTAFSGEITSSGTVLWSRFLDT